MRKFRIRKYSNLAAICSSYAVSVISHKQILWGMPFSLGVEITNNCNLNCPHCLSGSGTMTRKKGYMSESLFGRIVNELSGSTINTMFYFQGESMLHPDFFEMLARAREMGPIISTNGHFLSGENSQKLAELFTRKIVVSLDGLSDKAYSSYRVGGELPKVLNGIENLASELRRRKKLSRLVLQVLVSRSNENELDRIKDFANDIGVKVRFKSMQLIPGEGAIDILPDNSSFRRYGIRNGSVYLRGNRRNSCFRLWTNPVITWDGKVVPCCFDKDGQYIMGDLNETSFKEIWEGERYRQFRNRLLKDRSGIDICNNCTEGLYSGIKR